MRIIRIVSFIFAVMLITIQPLMICSADSTKAEIIAIAVKNFDMSCLLNFLYYTLYYNIKPKKKKFAT